MDLLIGDVFRNAARAVPGRVAAAFDDRTLTFAEIDRRANQLARALAARSVGPGDRVAVWVGTSLDVVPLFAALAKAGVVFAPVNPGLGPDEAAAVIALARPALLVVDGPREDLAARTPPAAATASVSLEALGAEAAAHDDGDVTPPGLGEGAPHVVFFTSGSTGRPKGVVLSHRVNFLRTHPGALLEPRGAMVCPYPLFHMGAWTIALQQWQARDRVVFEGTDAAAICRAVARHRATRLNAIPAVWRRILDHLASPDGATVDLSSIRFADSGTSATPLELLEAIQRGLPGAAVRVFYGSTESGSVASLEPADVSRKPGSCGVPAPSSEVRTDDAGELWVRGPLLFDGYFDDPQATAEAVVDGWYRTGDLAEVDADGYLSIVGRARDVVRSGGETVAPAEVEAVLALHPGVADVAVVGVPDPQWGEVVCAVVVAAADGPPPTVEALRAHCAGRLASFKHPRRVAVVDVIPRTAATNQVQRRLLVERLALAEPSG